MPFLATMPGSLFPLSPHFQQKGAFFTGTHAKLPPIFHFLSLFPSLFLEKIKRGSHAHAQWAGGAQQEQPQTGQEQDQQEEKVRL
jgi:hypothetical protein